MREIGQLIAMQASEQLVGSHQKHNQKTILIVQDRTGKVGGLLQQPVPQKQGWLD
jgi:hypothetical protein